MDIVTHGLVGVLAVRAFRSRTSWPVVAAAVGGALAPDLDGVAALWDPMAPITVHRTMTHSLIGGLPLAAGVAAVTKPWGHTSFPARAGFAYLGVLSHIGLDLLNPFGTAVLWPFASRRFGLGWLYVLDPAMTGLVALALVLSWWSTAYRNAVPRWAFGMMAAYALVAGVLGRVGETQWRALLADPGVAASRVAVVPTFPGPLRGSDRRGRARAVPHGVLGGASVESDGHHVPEGRDGWTGRAGPDGGGAELPGVCALPVAERHYGWGPATGRVLGPRVPGPPPRRTDGPPDHRRPVWRGAWR
jgi:membrane-bound metal-dependent hydrolase YbcI (DUF457 family)